MEPGSQSGDGFCCVFFFLLGELLIDNLDRGVNPKIGVGPPNEF